MKLSIFCTFGLKKLFLAVFHPEKMGSNIKETPKRHTLSRVRFVGAIKRENASTGLTCR